MFPEGAEQLPNLDVTVTPVMQVLGVIVVLALQFIKALVGRWPG